MSGYVGLGLKCRNFWNVSGLEDQIVMAGVLSALAGL